MENNSLCCQVCLTKFNRVSDFKRHVHSEAHQQKMREVFQKDVFRDPGFIPSIIVVDPLAKPEIKQPIIGLSLLTLCFSPDTWTFFYLCHVCEEKCPSDNILNHLSRDHCRNYFNYTDPNILSFSWIPSMDMRTFLKLQITKEVKERGSGTLQMLDLPEKLITQLQTSTYSEVMHTLNENDKFLKLFEATKPKRTMIQTYQRARNRKHPLLGLQHLVECICVGPPEKRYYLCTLCNLTLATHMIIKHVLSFDHIFCYFKAWHPSTLLSRECYTSYTKNFVCMMRDFAKQTEEIHETANTDMKIVSLKPAEFSLVNFSCYEEALKKLECIIKKNNGSSLITIIKPGNKLEYHPEADASVAQSIKLRCQNCSVVCENLFQYKRHLSHWKHKQMLSKLFREDEHGNLYDLAGTCIPHLGLYRCIQDGLRQNQPVIGVSLVVTCVCSQFQTDTIYVCIACKDSFLECVLKQHLKSQKHLISTVLYYNPWRLPFAWKDQVDVKLLRSMAWEEEEERGPNQRMLKVLDISQWRFHSLRPPSFTKVRQKLQQYYALLKNEVPHCETYRKLKQNERFPLLGRNFLVMYDICIRGDEFTKEGFLCLLCEKRLSDAECYAHDFSWEHVARFLDCFYPGSQSSSTDAETLLDLATQALRDHAISHIQKIKLHTPIWEPCSYHTTTVILASAKRRQGGGALQPPIRPKTKLFPRETLKKVDRDHVRENCQKNSTMERSENKTSQKSRDDNGDISKKISVELDSEITNMCSVKSEENVEKEAHEETSAPSDKESERDIFSETSPDEINNADGEICHLIKKEVEVKEEPDEGEAAKGDSKSYKDVVTGLKSYICKEAERKRPNSMFEKSQDAAGSDEDVVRDRGCKRQRLTSNHDASYEESQKNPSSGLKGVTTVLSAMDNIQVVVIDDDSEDSEAEQCSATTPKMTTAIPNSSTTTLFSVPTTSSTTMPRKTNHKCTATTSTATATSTKLTANTTNFTATASKHTAASFKLTGTHLTYSGGGSSQKALALKPSPVSKPLQSSTEAASRVTAPSCKAESTSQTGSTVVHEPMCRTASSSKITATSQIGVMIMSSDVAKTLVKCENTETSDVAPHIHKSSPPAAPHRTTAMSVRPKHTKPPTEPSHTSTTRTKANENIAKVGVNYLVAVTCGGKQQVFCILCSIRLKDSLHMVHYTHKYNYVKLKYPKWTAKLPEEMGRLNKIVAHLAEVEKDIGSQRSQSIKVTSEEYQALRVLSDSKALERVKKMLRERNLQASSSSSTDLKRELKSNLKEKVDQSDRAQNWTNKCPEADDVIPDQSQMCGSFKNNPDSIPAPGNHNEHRAVKQKTIEPDVEAQAPHYLSTRKNQTGEKIKQDKFEEDVEAQTHVQVTPPSPGGSPGPGQHSISQTLPTISVGSTSQANLSRYLEVKGLSKEPIIGLGDMWECQGQSEMSFFLCESCRMMISLKDIYQHIVSPNHQFKYIRKQYPHYLLFWNEENLTLDKKLEILKGVAQLISEQEHCNKKDAQGVFLSKELYKCVLNAPFSEALQMVQNIKKDEKLSVLCLPTTTLQNREKQSEKEQSQKEFLQRETPEKDQRGDNGAREKIENRHLEEETAIAGDLVGVKHRTALNPLNVTSALTKTDSVVFPFPGLGTCLDVSSPFVQPELKPVIQHQRPVAKMQVTQVEVHVEPQSSYRPTVSPKSSLSLPLSPKDKCLSSRKRPADTSVETQVRTWTDNAQLKEP